MKEMERIALMLAAVLISCAPTQIWLSNPEKAEIRSSHFAAVFQPLKQDDKFYASFRLVIRNLTDKPLYIDWNRTQYLHNGQKLGKFAFYGIEPEDIRNESIPPDTIAPGQSLSRQIAPVRFVAFNPYREGSASAEESRLSFGILPEGENAIMLVLGTGGGEVRQGMSVRLSSKVLSP